MKYLLLALLVLSTTAMSADKKIAAATPKKSTATDMDSKTLDVTPESKNKEITDETALYTNTEKVKVKFSCKAKDGHELKQGEKGYEECLQKVKNDKNNPHEPNADIKVDFEK